MHKGREIEKYVGIIQICRVVVGESARSNLVVWMDEDVRRWPDGNSAMNNKARSQLMRGYDVKCTASRTLLAAWREGDTKSSHV